MECSRHARQWFGECIRTCDGCQAAGRGCRGSRWATGCSGAPRIPLCLPPPTTMGLPPGEVLRTLEGHARTVTAVALAPDGSRAVSAGGVTLKVWDLATGTAGLKIWEAEILVCLRCEPPGLQLDDRRIVLASRLPNVCSASLAWHAWHPARDSFKSCRAKPSPWRGVCRRPVSNASGSGTWRITATVC